ncbi:MAG TPA: hypothetical protein DDW55_13320 [Gammaproteobacteria bacterium]|nr:hypothetical protein [Gammaproteobacteria bacterium]
MKHLLIILLATITNIVWADEGVDITNPTQVLELHNLQEKLDAVSATIMGCIDSGEEHGTCMCKHKELILQFNSSVKSLFSSHPDFVKLDIVRFKTPDGIWVSQSLKGIRKQAGIEPSCT